jgi:alpha-mannosidase
MRQNLIRLPIVLLACLLMVGAAWAQTAPPAATAPAATAAKAAATTVTAPPKPAPIDLSKAPGTLYVIGYAHLDTEWRWDYVTTINEYIRNTLYDNFYLIEKYPHYVFNFSGATRYLMMKEYYPAEYQKVKKYVAAGRWFPAGSSMEENDVNSPSAESIIRQILYGKHFFRKEFGFTSSEFMLPDCFGFPASLPSILNHMGLKGFSTQKLSASWQPAPKVGGPDSIEKTPEGIPFNVGLWEGPDGKTIVAALNPGSYSGGVSADLSKSPAPPDPNNPQQRRREEDWVKRIALNGEVTGVFADYHYYGTGDMGGSPAEGSIALIEATAAKSKMLMPPQQSQSSSRRPFANPLPAGTGEQVQFGDGPLRVVSATAEQMFNDIKPSMYARLPRYKGDLELINHSAGSITSQAYMKRWNRKNELLADAAEKASIAAQWLGGRPYPQQRLNEAWQVVTLGQFHDIIPGTSIPKAYEYAWNNEVLAMNEFAGVMTSATQAVASALNTQTTGAAVVVYNPLNVGREDVVEATVKFTGGTPNAVRVVGPDGQAVPAQVSNGKALFLAKVPSVGYAVYDVQAATSAAPSTLKVTQSSLENARYAVKLDQNGDISGIFDKQINKELLSAPIRLAIKTDVPRQWPAWNMDWADEVKPPRAFVSGPAKIRIVENGPARVALEVERTAEGSKFVQTIRLSAGDAGNRVEIGHVMDWKIKESNLKVRFPLTASNENATYNWDIGAIERPTAYDRQFEVASHQWIDLTDKSGAFGATILTDCKNASDKGDDKTISLTLVRTPGGTSYPDQYTQDWGHHELIYGIAGHAGDWRQAQTDWQAQRLNQPLMAFESEKHAGALGKTFSMLKVNSDRVRVLALKKAEDSGEVIVRLVELDGKQQPKVKISFAGAIASAREVNGNEEAVGPATVTSGALVADLGPYQPRTFAVTLAPATTKVAAPTFQPLTLPYNHIVTSKDGARPVNGFDSQGRAIPAELLPGEIAYAGIKFKLAGTNDKPNAVVPRGQTISLPAGQFNRVYILAAAAEGGQPGGGRGGAPPAGQAASNDQQATFKVGDKTVDLTVQNWTGYVGQWDNRLWRTVPVLPQQGGQAPGGRGGGAAQGPRMVETYDGLVPGFVKTAPVAWFATHRHTLDGTNDTYQFSYLYTYALDVPAGAKTVTLPDNVRIRILAMTVANDGPAVQAAQPLYDTLEQHADSAFYERGVALRASGAAAGAN